MLKKGDRVKLTVKVAAMATRNGWRSRRKKPIDWASRRGTVLFTVTPGSGSVIIRWDGIKTFDSWPLNAVELAEK